MKRAAILLLVMISVIADAQTLLKSHSGTDTSIRGLSVVNEKIAWASGSNGWFARTTDGARTWQWQQLVTYRTLDFRDIEAFSADDAVMVNAGSPAVILRTSDGGRSWKEVYRNNSPDIFIDGADFSNTKKGIAYGDPIIHKLQLLRTTDGGASWHDISSNLTEPLDEGEAAFAASGTGIQALHKKIWLATGGTKARIFHSTDFGNNWQYYSCPVLQGENSTGVFSIAFRNAHAGVAIGGDYRRDTLRTKNMACTNDGGKTWKFPVEAPFGYRSAICYVTRKMLIATGTSGTDVSYDGGKTWKMFSPEGFNTIAKSRKGKLVICAGLNGKISIIKY